MEPNKNVINDFSVPASAPLNGTDSSVGLAPAPVVSPTSTSPVVAPSASPVFDIPAPSSSLEVTELPTEPIVDETTVTDTPSTPLGNTRPVNIPLQFNKQALFYTMGAALVIALLSAGIILLASKGREATGSLARGNFATATLPVKVNEDSADLKLGQAEKLAVNGELEVNKGLVVKPGVAPQSPSKGSIYYDQTSNQPYYYNGVAFVPLGGNQIGSYVQNIGGINGVIQLGNGLVTNGNVIEVSAGVLGAASGAKVTSLQGLNGDIQLVGGNGVAISGTTIANTGVISIAAGSGINIVNDGNGNYTIDNAAVGPGGAVLLGSAVAQTDSSNNPSININKTGTGNLVQLAVGGVNRFVIDPTGRITVGTIDFSDIQNVPSIVNTIGGLSGGVGLGAGLGVSGSNLVNTGVTSLSGTPNQVSISSSTGAITLSLPQNIHTSATPTFQGLTLNSGGLILNDGSSNTGTLQVASLGQNTVYTLSDPGVASVGICLSTGNCPAAGAAGGDLTGTYPNPTIAYLQGVTLATSSVSSGQILQYNGAAWVNQTVTGDVSISNSGVTTIGAGTVTNAKLQNSSITINTGTGLSGGAAISLGGSATLSVQYGSVAGTAVEGDKTIACPAGTGNLTGGGSTITLGSGGSCGNLTIVNNPVFSGTVTTTNAGGFIAGVAATTNGQLTLANSTNSNLSILQSAAPSGTGNATFLLPTIAGGSSDTICTVNAGNCAGSGGGVVGSGTTNTIAKFTGSGTIGDSNLTDDGATLTYTGDLIVTGSSAFTGMLTANGGLTVDNNSNFIQTGNGTFATGAGGVSLNGNTTITGSNTLTVGTGATTLGGILNVTGASTFTDMITANGGLQVTSALGATLGVANATDGLLTFANSSNSNLTLLQAAAPSGTGSATFTLPSIAGGSSDEICTVNSGNCAGSGGGITGSGTNGIIAVFTGAGAIGNSNLIDLGGTLTYTGANGLLLGVANTVAGSLALANTSNSNLSLLQSAAPSGTGNATFLLPTIAGGSSDTICTVNAGNCAGSGGGIVGSGTPGALAKFTGSGASIGDSYLSETGHLLTYDGMLAVQPVASLVGGDTLVVKSLTNASSTGGTVIGESTTISVNNTSSVGTTKGYDLQITDSSSLNNTNIGMDLSVTSTTPTVYKFNTGLKVSVASSTAHSTDLGADISVGHGMGLKAVSSSFGDSVNCGFLSGQISIGVCGISTNTAAAFGSYGSVSYSTQGASSSAVLTNIVSSQGGVASYSNNTISSASSVVNAGSKSVAQNSSVTGSYTTVGQIGIASAYSATASVYGGYFTVDAANAALNGAALYSTTASYAATSGNGRNAVYVLQSAGGSGQATTGTSGQTAGAGAGVSLAAGAGGASTGATGANVGGAGGSVTIQAGNGGDVTSASGTSGAGGNILLKAGQSGTGGATAGAVGSVIVQNIANGASAFQVQTAAGINVFNVDTINSRVGTAGTTTASTNSQSFSLQSGDATGATSNSGNVSIDVGTATGTTGTLSLGSINASSVTISKVGVTTTIGGDLSVAGAAAFQRGSDYSTVGVSNNVNFGSNSLVRLTGGSAQTITGIANGLDGRILTLVNAGSTTATIADNSGSSSANNRITTGTGADVSLLVGGSITMIYDSGDSLWRVVGAVAGAGGGGGVTTVGVFDGCGGPSANGASISGVNICLQSASASVPGLVNNTGQTFSGAKTFADALQGNTGLTVTGAEISLNANSNFNTNINTGTSTGAVNIGSSNAGTIAITSGSDVDLVGVDVSLNGGSATGTVTLGNSASGVVALQSATAVNINAGTSVAATNVGNSLSGVTTIQSATDIVLNPGGTGNTGVSVRPLNDSDAAFTIQNAAQTTTVLNADTTGYGKLTVSGGTVSSWAKFHSDNAGPPIAKDMIETSDGGYVVMGGNANGPVVFKTDAFGNVVWNRSANYGSSYTYNGQSVTETTDGGIVVVGYATVGGPFGNSDAYVVKYNKNGDFLWDKAWGGVNADSFASVKATSDGGVIVTGSTQSFGAGGNDLILAKFTSAGALSWDRVWGGAGSDSGQYVLQKPDNSYYVIAQTASFGAGSSDVVVIRYDSSGNFVGDETWGTASSDIVNDARLTSDGGLVMAVDSGAAVIVKYTSGGTLDWDYGWDAPSGTNSAGGVYQLQDGSYVLTGVTSYYGAGSNDVLLVRLDDTGALLWDSTFGGTGSDSGRRVYPTSDGGYIVGGLYRDVPNGDNTYLMAKFDQFGGIHNCGSACSDPASPTYSAFSASTSDPASTTSGSTGVVLADIITYESSNVKISSTTIVNGFSIGEVALNVAGSASIEGGLDVGGTTSIGGALSVTTLSTSAFTINNATGASIMRVDTANSQLTIAGIKTNSAAADLALDGNCSGTNWSGSGTGPYTHSAGSTTALTCAVTGGVVPGMAYEISYTQTLSSPATGITPTFGGSAGQKATGSISYITNKQIIQAGSSTSTFSFAIDNSADTGSISNISVRQLYGSNSAFNVLDTDNGSDLSLEVRASADYRNTFIGLNSGSVNTTSGTDNTAFGYRSLKSNTSGDANVAFGTDALLLNSTGNGNTGIGYKSLTANISGIYNSAIGHNALLYNTSGQYNTALGMQAGTTQSSSNANTVGNYNTFLGYNSGPGVSSSFNLQNSAAIGRSTVVNSNDTLVLGCVSSINGCGSQGSSVSIGSGGYATKSGSTLNALTIGASTYNTGTVGVTGSTVTGSGTVFASGMVGGTIYYVTNTGSYVSGYISSVNSATSITLSTSPGTVSAGASYVIVWGGQRISSLGASVLQNTTDSTSAFQIQSAAGVALFNADTSNLVIKVAGNTTTFATLEINNAHFKSTQTTAPTIGTPTACGTTPTATMTAGSTDSAGRIQISTGTGSPTTCTTTITFNKAYGSSPKSVIVSAHTTSTGNGFFFVKAPTVTSTTFDVSISDPAGGTTASSTYYIYYWVIE